jgi:predicted nuclease of predicted toxin-antitoxin system
MRFLVDAQLPPALARSVAERGHTAEHVYHLLTRDELLDENA